MQEGNFKMQDYEVTKRLVAAQRDLIKIMEEQLYDLRQQLSQSHQLKTYSYKGKPTVLRIIR